MQEKLQRESDKNTKKTIIKRNIEELYIAHAHLGISDGGDGGQNEDRCGRLRSHVMFPLRLLAAGLVLHMEDVHVLEHLTRAHSAMAMTVKQKKQKEKMK